MKETAAAMSTSDNDFVTVDMPSENEVGPSAVGAAADDPPSEQIIDEESHRQRSLLKTLWSEATSTTDLPSAPSNNRDRLHHRRTTTKASPSSKYARKGSNSNDVTPSKRRTGRQSTHRFRVSRGQRIAKRVWLAAFSAFAASVLITIHVFLYRAFMGGSSDNSNSGVNVDNFGAVMKNGMPILGSEDQQAKMTLAEAHSHTLASINEHSIDTSQYTIRINTWQRNEQLLLSIDHHAKCEGVKEIQIIWCDSNSEPPNEVVHHKSGKIKIEKHAINSLNERFKVMLDAPTLGILSLDDDVMRPCVALDAAFVRWTRHPERMVGFDVRSHVVDYNNNEEKNGKEGKNNKSHWKYGYMSTTEASKRYSISLPRASFIHRDYLDLYTMALPRPIYTYVAQNLECEDIAMSFLVSSLTQGKSPMVADYWAVKSMVKLYSAKKISGGSGHKSTRDNCVNDFAELLGLKENGEWPLQPGKLVHKNKFFGYGTEPEDWSNVDVQAFQSSRLQDVVRKMQELQSTSNDERMKWLMQTKAEVMMEAQVVGMIENTKEWKERWKK